MGPGSSNLSKNIIGEGADGRGGAEAEAENPRAGGASAQRKRAFLRGLCARVTHVPWGCSTVSRETGGTASGSFSLKGAPSPGGDPPAASRGTQVPLQTLNLALGMQLLRSCVLLSVPLQRRPGSAVIWTVTSQGPHPPVCPSLTYPPIHSAVCEQPGAGRQAGDSVVKAEPRLWANTHVEHRQRVTRREMACCQG